MAQTTQAVPRLRSLGRRSCSNDYQIHTQIIGKTVELHAVHLKTEERFIARASEWDLALSELDQLLIKYGPNESSSRQATARRTGNMDRIRFVSRFLTNVVRRLRCQYSAAKE